MRVRRAGAPIAGAMAVVALRRRSNNATARWKLSPSRKYFPRLRLKLFVPIRHFRTRVLYGILLQLAFDASIAFTTAPTPLARKSSVPHARLFELLRTAQQMQRHSARFPDTRYFCSVMRPSPSRGFA
jgi:hypothetical protein